MGIREKVIKAANEEEAVEYATRYFSLTSDEIAMKQLGTTWDQQAVYLIYQKDMDDIYKNADGRFYLCYESGGVFLEVIPAQGSGIALDKDVVRKYIQRKQLSGVDSDQIDALLEIGFGYERIAVEQQEIPMGEDMEVEIEADAMTAYAVLLEPELGGKMMTMEGAKQLLIDKGITYGVQEMLLEQMLTEKTYGRRYLIAMGIAPVNGEDATLTFHFRFDLSGTPMLEENGKVDYKNLDLFESVHINDKLITKTPATEGESGWTVRGAELKAKRGKDVQMPRGDKVRFNEEKTEMYAAVTGRVEYRGGKVTVTNVFEVSGDVDFSIGNIEFPGDVMVRGNVLSGFTIRAKGRVDVKGGVQSASIFAEGDVTIANGIQGMDNGYVESGGILSSKFIERCKVKAKVGVVADQIMHSFIECEGDVQVKGNYGILLGGETKANNMVAAKVLGSDAGIATLVEVGINPSVRNELTRVEKDIAAMTESVEKYDKIIAFIKTKQQPTPEQQDMLRKSIMAKLENAQKIDKLKIRKEELGALVENIDRGKVHVSRTTYPGVTMIISMKTYIVKGTTIPAATFRKATDGEVTFGACEFMV